MDKVYYYARKTKMVIEKSIEELDNHELLPSRVPKPDDDVGVFSNDEDSDDSDDDDGNVEADADEGELSDSDDESLSTNSQGLVEPEPPPLVILSFSQQVKKAWAKRSSKIMSDFSIAGWMLSVVPEIRRDVEDNAGGHHRLAMERIIMKLHAHE